MDKTINQIIGALQSRIRDQLQSLGDFPKAEQFDHGVQVGTYQGLQAAMDAIEQVLSDELEAETRR
mgnify:CR=1 FL=1